MILQPTNRSLKTITINFDPHHICNYQCPYCFIPDKKADDYRPFSDYSSVANWIEAFSRIENNIHFSVSGIGEPTLLKDFYQFTKYVSELENVLSVVIYSNMSSPKFFDPFFDLNEKVYIIPSFHHKMVEFPKFKDTVYPYLGSGKIPFFQNVYDRSYAFEEIESWRKDILSQGFQLRLMPDFRLQDLTSDELNYLRRYRYDSEWDYLLFNEKTCGKNCSTGMNYIFLKSNGDAFRCVQSGDPIGNVLSNFNLFKQKRACPMKTCGTSIREFTHIWDNSLYVKDNIEVGCTIQASKFIRHLIVDMRCFNFHMILYAILARKLSSDFPLLRPSIDMTSTEGLSAYFVTSLKPDIVTRSGEGSSRYPQFGFAWADDLKIGNSISFRLAFILSSNGDVSIPKTFEFYSKSACAGGYAVFGTPSRDGLADLPGDMKIIREMHAIVPSEKLLEINGLMRSKAADSVVDYLSDMTDWLEICERETGNGESYHVYLLRKN